MHGALRLTIDAHEVSERIQRFWIGLVAIAAVVLLAVATVGWAIARSVTRPIRQLQSAAHRFAEGDLQTAALDEEAPPEIAELGETMNKMAARLDELLTAQRAFVSDASHQLRTPLTALRLRLENLEAGLDDDDGIVETSAAIDEIERLSTLIDDLLRLAKAEQHRGCEVIDAKAIVTDRVDTWSALADERGIDFQLTAPSGQVFVLAIPGALEQVLDNAIDNALRVTHLDGTIEIHVVSGAETTTFMIRDQGPGLSDSDKQRALERFWRADATTTGSGLGLAIAQSLTEASGGSLRLVDSPVGGLTVVIELESTPASAHMPAR